MRGLFRLYTSVTGIIILLVTTLSACSPLATPASTPIPPTATSVTGLQAINGTSLYYESLGQGAPLFVLHGGPGGSHRYFLPYLADLAADHHLFFYDQRGTGLSDGHLELEAISIDQFVEDLEALRVAFGLEKISLMGHSWGGMIALAYALKYQAHLDHLILVDSISVNKTFSIEFGKTIQQRVQSLSADEQQELNTTCTRPSAKLTLQERDECNQLDAQLRFSDPAKAATVNWAVEENTLKNSGTVRALLLNSFNRVQHDMDTQLSTVHVPTLIVHGDFDPIPVASSEYLHQQIPGSQLVLISQSGHFPFIEQPEQFIAALRAFLKT
jgi:proline iminopeptidase